MTCLTQAILLLTLVSFLNADVCDKNFLVRLEDITQTNSELSEVNKLLNMTVVEQRAIIDNYTSAVWHKAIQPKKWRENFPAIKIPFLFMA